MADVAWLGASVGDCWKQASSEGGHQLISLPWESSNDSLSEAEDQWVYIYIDIYRFLNL